ncbi:hypothetical protein PR048_016559 [Dryococelus australis]|uniref:Secreted protein n=1 Tax=Dryococelus australis TaxID=614101 RepID=A0ABQ9HK30_9NEOP|nr:hypothetical protein PR048_016559 [Dryococelus australis]
MKPSDILVMILHTVLYGMKTWRAVVLISSVQADTPGNVHRLTFSDTCAGQNRNIAVAVMFMVAIQQYSSSKDSLDIQILNVIVTTQEVNVQRRKWMWRSEYHMNGTCL